MIFLKKISADATINTILVVYALGFLAGSLPGLLVSPIQTAVIPRLIIEAAMLFALHQRKNAGRVIFLIVLYLSALMIMFVLGTSIYENFTGNGSSIEDQLIDLIILLIISLTIYQFQFRYDVVSQYKKLKNSP